MYTCLNWSLILFLIMLETSAQSNKCPPSLLINILKSYNDKVSFKIVYLACSKTDSFKTIKALSKEKYFITSLKIPFSEQIPFFHPLNKLIYILDLSCNASYETLENANKLFYFSSPYHWILINQKQNINEYTKDLEILSDSDVLVINPNLEGFDLFKIYKPRVEMDLIFEDYGQWINDSLDIQMFSKYPLSHQRKDLRGILFYTCLVVTHNETYLHLEDKRQKHVDSITKVSYILIRYIGEMLNATLRFNFESNWGYKDNEGNWTGMILQLANKDIDIGGTPLFVTIDRFPIVDYIAMTTATRSKFVFRQPKLSYITNVFTLPFTASVWYASFGLVAIITVALFVVIKWEWYKKKVFGTTPEDKKQTENQLKDSYLDILLMAIGAVCQQGASAVPYNNAGRIITILLYIFLMFLYTSYSANIVALLQSSSTSIQTLNDLLRSRLQVGVDDTVFNRFFFPNATEPIRKALYRQKVAPPGQKANYMPIEDGVRRMRGGLFAFHMETGAGYKIVGETFIEDEKCGLQEIQFLEVPDPFIAVPKNSSFKEALKIGFRKIFEYGLQSREVKLIYTPRPTCLSRGSSFIGVGIIDCYPAAMILLGGAATALFIFFLEILYYKLREIKTSQ